MTSAGSTYSAVGIVKSYAGVRVLHGVDFVVHPGTIHGLFGHNGAGKSTLLKILAGAARPDSGDMSIDGKAITLSSPRDALDQGIGCVYQELRQIPDLTVTENLFLGREERCYGLKNDVGMIEYARKLLTSYGLRVDPLARIRDLSHPEKQMIEVIANLDRKARFLLLDEPTTAIDGRHAEELLRAVRQIAIERQIGVVLVSHKIDEVLSVCDEATVMMAGRSVLHAERSSLSKQAIVGAIVGDEAHRPQTAPIRNKLADSTAFLRVRNLKTNRLKRISLEARAGEVLGIYGLAGAGRTRFCRAIYGMEPIAGGEIQIDGRPYEASSPAKALASGIAYLTEDRKRDGFISEMSSLRNVVLSTLRRYRTAGIVNQSAADKTARSALARLRTHGRLEQTVLSLSGGNQQKVLFARIIEQNARIVMLDEPTKGVDVGAKSDIYAIVRRLAEEGRCVIVVSSEEEEILEVADRVVVFRQGVCDSPATNIADASVAYLRQAAWAPLQ
jgi:ABC-type sugar transport system ATPase subunit